MDTRIEAIKKTSQELKHPPDGIQAVNRNAGQIFASEKMLETGITDI
jgi:hypothetical protein